MIDKKQITFFVNKNEKALIDHEAERVSLPTASYCRSEILRKINQEAIA